MQIRSPKVLIHATALEATCGVRIAIHGTDAELIVTSCEKCSGLITIRRQCVISSFFSFAWS